MNNNDKSVNSITEHEIEEAMERFAQHREQPAEPASTRLSLLGGLLVLLVLALASFNAQAQLPDPGMQIDPARTAVVITDPQNDFLSPQGVTWGVVGNSVTENNTVENIESLMKAAKANDLPLFVSPHYYYPTDHGWRFEGALEKLMHTIGMFDRKGPLTLEGFKGSLHTLAHGWNKPEGAEKLGQWDRFMVEQLTYFLDRLASAEEQQVSARR